MKLETHHVIIGISAILLVSIGGYFIYRKITGDSDVQQALQQTFSQINIRTDLTPDQKQQAIIAAQNGMNLSGTVGRKS